MIQLNEIFQTADWKKEKHVPVIDIPERAKKGENIRVVVTVGREIAHPNTTEHHITWIDVYFRPEADKFSYHLGRYEFLSHGGSVQGPNTSTVFTHPEAVVVFKTEKPGVIFAVSNCNLHGLWANSQELKIS